jgi:hypothetical protein
MLGMVVLNVSSWIIIGLAIKSKLEFMRGFALLFGQFEIVETIVWVI